MKTIKAQVGAKELFTSLIIIFSLAIVGFLTFANVTNTAKDVFPTVNTLKENESVTIASVSSGDNSTLLSKKGYVVNTETVKNASGQDTLTRDVEYKITMTGVSGDLENRANFTLLNVTNSSAGSVTGYNNSELKVTYEFEAKSAGRVSAEKVDDTTLDAFELGVVGLIVMAAVTVLSIVYYLVK